MLRALRTGFRGEYTDFRVTGGLRNVNNTELRDFYTSPNIIRVIKSLRMRRLEHLRDEESI